MEGHGHGIEEAERRAEQRARRRTILMKWLALSLKVAAIIVALRLLLLLAWDKWFAK
jgi:hypothetical protein